jgi:1,4-dihydroxy-2-naphthoate octaprenyltransferase
VGKRTVAVRLGDARTRVLYQVLVGSAFVVVVIAAAWRPPALLGLLAVPLAAPVVGAVRRGAVGPALIAVLGGTGRLQLAYGVTFAVGLAIGG